MFVFVLVSLIVAAGATLISFHLLKWREDIAVLETRSEAAQARILLKYQQQIQKVRLEASKDAAQGRALDEFLSGFRVEERRAVVVSPGGRRVVQEERLLWGADPLTPWAECAAVPGAPAPVKLAHSHAAPAVLTICRQG